MNLVNDGVYDSSPGSDNDEDGLYLKGPPFSPKDYMISPSESDIISKKESRVSQKKKLRPFDLKIDSFEIDARKALKKLRYLIRDKFGRILIKRQLNLVCIIVNGMSTGFHLEDISYVVEIMEYFSFNYKSTPEYKQMINMLLQIAMNLPKIAKSSDALKYKKEFSDYFTMFGELLVTFDDHCIQHLTLKILSSLLIRPQPTELSCIKLCHCHTAMEESLLPYIIASMLETVSEKLYSEYLEIALEIASTSNKACIVMIRNGALEFVLCRLDPHYHIRDKRIPPVDESYAEDEFKMNNDYKILDYAGNLLWTFLSVITDYKIECESPSQDALWSLRYLLHAEAKKKTKKAIATRNNLAGITVKLYSVFGEKLPLISSGLAVDIAILSVATEIGTENSWAENIKLGTNKEDYLLKQMMLICCCELAKNEAALEVLRTQKVIEGILYLINPQVNPLKVSWMPSQFWNLFLLALSVLSELVPILQDVYVTNKGNSRLLMALEWFTEEHFDQKPLLETVKTLCAIVTCKNNSVIIQDIKDQSGVKIILSTCFYSLESQSLRKKDQEILSRIFIILEKLCSNETKIQAYLGNLYVAVSIKFLCRVVKNNDDDNKIDPQLLICFFGFLWETIAWCPVLLKSFTEQKGIYLLLDVLQMCSFPVQVMVLGVLVDMSDEGDTLTHLLTWRDRDGYGLLNKMIEIWRAEELLNKVARTEDGCIADIERPLMSEEQWYVTTYMTCPHIFSPAIAEMMCNARPKIHSLYQILMNRYNDMTQLNESLYSIKFNVVKPQYQVYIPLIEHYLILKLGEVWYEVYLFFTFIIGGFVPSFFDGGIVSTLLEEKKNWAYRLKAIQEEIITFQKIHGYEEESKLYQLLRSSCLAPALDALHDLDYIARTTLKEFQVSKKEKQLKEIEESLNTSEFEGTHIHSTSLPNINVTFLSGKYVWFKSEKEAVLESNIIRPISSDDSECNEFPD